MWNQPKDQAGADELEGVKVGRPAASLASIIQPRMKATT